MDNEGCKPKLIYGVGMEGVAAEYAAENRCSVSIAYGVDNTESSSPNLSQERNTVSTSGLLKSVRYSSSRLLNRLRFFMAWQGNSDFKPGALKNKTSRTFHDRLLTSHMERVNTMRRLGKLWGRVT